MSDVLVVAGHALRESLRRRVFAVVVVPHARVRRRSTRGARASCSRTCTDFGGNEFGLDPRALAGATILGLAMFGTLFLGVVLAVFLTLGAVRGDAERGLLQPLIVRPLGRRQYLAGRFLAAGVGRRRSTSSSSTRRGRGDRRRSATGGRATPSARACASPRAVVVVAALALLGSIFLSANANGIAVLMVFGAGLLGRAARLGRRRAELEHAADDREHRRRGCCPSRRSTATRCACSSPRSRA